MNKKALYLLLGIVLIVLGVLSLLVDGVMILLCGIGLIVYGISNLVNWNNRRKSGTASGWGLAGSLLSIAAGVTVLFGTQLGVLSIYILLILLSIWIIACGVLEVIGAVMYRKAMTTVDLGVQAPGSMSSMVIGVVMAAVGVLGIIFPYFGVTVIGLIIVIGLIAVGIKMIWTAKNSGILEESDE